MIEVTVAYPAGQGRTFNMDYYLKTHIPLFSKTNGRGDENHSGITRNWRQYAESARGLRGYGARHLRLR
jgi:hypothetical protein